MTAPILTTWGGDLTEADYASLAARWITRELADQSGIRRVDSITGMGMFARKRGNLAGLIIPNMAPWDSHPRNYRLRLDNPDLQYRSDGTVRETNKYLQPPEARNTIYFPIGVAESTLTDTTLPAIVTEGEFKAIALWRLATRDVVSPRFLPVSFNGVWSWRGIVGKHPGPNGDRRDVKGVIPDVDRITWKGRRVAIAFDADSEHNPAVRSARGALTSELIERGAVVGYLEWPIDEGKGIDDRLAAIGPERVLADITALEYGGWQTRLLRNDAGKMLACHENAALFMQNAPEWAGVIGFNEFTGGHYVRRQPPAPVTAVPGAELEDHFDTEVVRWLERRGMLVKPDLVRRVIDSVSRRNAFHPIRDYLDPLVWDGQSRIRTWLIDYCGVAGSDSDSEQYVTSVGEKFLVSAVARVMEPGCKADHMLVLEGPQGIGKTTLVRILAGEDWFTDQIADLGSKDASMQLRGVWIVELSELAAMGRAELERQKVFISQQAERFRLPYGHRIVHVPRQCVFIGTTNSDTWLKDETGGRRFWPVRCGRIDLARLKADRDQLWAESVVRYRAGASWWLDDAEVIQQAVEEQRGRFLEDPWAGEAVKYAEEESILPMSAPRGSVSIPEILTRMGIDLAKRDQVAMNRVARCIKSAGWERFRQRSGSGLEWRYRKAVGV